MVVLIHIVGLAVMLLLAVVLMVAMVLAGRLAKVRILASMGLTSMRVTIAMASGFGAMLGLFVPFVRLAAIPRGVGLMIELTMVAGVPTLHVDNGASGYGGLGDRKSVSVA